MGQAWIPGAEWALLSQEHGARHREKPVLRFRSARFHLRTRSLSGKLIQVMRALQLERHYSKTEILEAYLNLAPYGRNIEGAAAATQVYFDKTPARLTSPEAVALSVIPQSPTRRTLFHDRDNPFVNAAQNNWYRRLGDEISDELSASKFSARVEREKDFPAPHFVQQVLENSKSNRQIVTTLDLEKQRLVEKRLTDYITTNRARGTGGRRFTSLPLSESWRRLASPLL